MQYDYLPDSPRHLLGRRDPMSTRYRLRASIPATLIGAKGHKVSVTIPAGAILRHLRRLSVRLGIAHIFWEGQKYAISEEDLNQYAELVESA
jgi:hypothetical protein